MTPDRWRQIEQLYHDALDRAPGERELFLAEAYAGDDALRHEVESLLGFDDPASSFIETPPNDVVAGMMAEGQARSMIGRTLGHYWLHSLLGAGGMGEVYRAHDIRLDRDVAVKILPEHLAQDAEALRRFEREAKAVAALSHPNILAIHDFGNERSVSYAVMELLEGETLRSRLQRGLPGWREALEIGAAIADGLAAAHAKGIIHRDLKPENIFLTSGGGVKVLDFGIARVKHMVLQDSDTLTTGIETTGQGVVMGTLGYMSPEQLRGEEAEPPSDLFSLGCVLYEMISGQRPFARNTGAEMVAAILHEEPPALSGIENENLGGMERVIRHCLGKSTSERYQSARELASDLKALLNGQTISAPVAARKRPVSRFRIAIAVVILLLLGIAVASSLYSRSGQAIDSLAVLPFVNVGGDPNTEYLADGISESISYSISQLPKLKVMSRNAVLRYKDHPADALIVGRELGVKAVVIGRVALRGDQLTISIELINARDNSLLWGNQHYPKLADVLTVQTEIAQRITENLRLNMTGEDQRRLTKHYTQNSEAYQLYLKGRYYLGKLKKDSVEQGFDYFRKALDLDPTYALGWAGLADAYYGYSNIYWPPAEAMPKAREAAMRALRADDNLAEAHASLAMIKSQYDWDWAGAEREYKRTLELNPRYMPAYPVYGIFFLGMARTEEALTEFRRLQELDPLSSSIAVTATWSFYWAPPAARRPDRAIGELQKIIATEPEFFPAHSQLGVVYLQKNMFDQAIAELSKAVQLDNNAENLGWLGYSYGAAGRKDMAMKTLGDLKERAKRGEHVSAFTMAIVHTGLREDDQALDWLQKAYNAKDEYMILLNVDPKFDTLRSDPRFTNLLRRMNLAP